MYVCMYVCMYVYKQMGKVIILHKETGLIF